MNWFIFIILITGVPMLIGLIILLVYYYNKEKSLPEIKKDQSVINLLPHFTNGHSQGWIQDIKPSKNNRNIVEFIPTDYTPKELEDIKTETIVIDKLHTVPKGRMSKNCNTTFLIPKDISDLDNVLPEELKNGFTKSFTIERNQKYLLEAFDEGDKAIKDVMKNWKRGNLSDKEIKKMQETYELAFKILRGESEGKQEEKSKK